MSAKKEAQEDFNFYLVETRTEKPFQKYEFGGQNGPIIGIHGVTGGWAKDGLKRFMEENNVSGTLMYLGKLLNRIDSYLPILDTELKKHKLPTLVGLSTGGLIALRYASKYNAWDRINKIVTIATPFMGYTKLLKYVFPNLQDLVNSSEILTEIRNFKPPENKVISLFAKEDKMIPKPNKIQLNWPSIITNAQSHGDILNHQKWYQDELKKVALKDKL
jgi:pimeloyl-ACP methyl ester carboxylesterase